MSEFDKDEKAVNVFIKANPNAFNAARPFDVVSARSGLAELMLDARIDVLVVHEGYKPEYAEEVVLAYLEKSKS